MSELGAAALQAGGDIAGAVIGSASSKKEGKRAWRRTKKLNQNMIQWRVEDARKAGLHPLAALGIGAGGGQIMPDTGSALGDGLAAATSSIAQGIRGRADRKRAAALDAQATMESNARITRELAEADLAKAQAGRIRSDWILDHAKASTAAVAKQTAVDPSYSKAHTKLVTDVEPGAWFPPMKLPQNKIPGTVTLRGAGGFEMPWNVEDTPQELVEALGGEGASMVMTLNNILHNLPKAYKDKRSPWYWRWIREKLAQGNERFNKWLREDAERYKK